MRLFQQPRPADDMVCREFYTILLDLRKEAESLLACMKKGTRYEIRRAAEKDELVYEFWEADDCAQVFEEFCDYYDEFAAQKGQPKLNRPWLSLMAGTLALSRVRDGGGDGGTLVWHFYYLNGGRATLLYSASLFRNSASSAHRNRVGRANRFQHWQDIMRFKEAGLALYDFGGWYHGADDPERLGINRFKEEFGGEVVKNYICERGVTVKGKVFLRLRQALLGDAI
ncbi:MAG TPA: hypothetical protein VF507_08925 [Pyrinomonadaceae bacterium]